MLAQLRQLKYPREFRIAAPASSEEMLRKLEAVAQLLRDSHQSPAGEEDAGALAAFLSDVVTGLWRVRQKLSPLEGAEASRETRSLARAIASTWDTLKQGGVEIAEHAGEFITGGERFHVLTFQPTPGLDRERVIETIKPTVYYRGRMIQAGQVIVGTPG